MSTGIKRAELAGQSFKQDGFAVFPKFLDISCIEHLLSDVAKLRCKGSRKDFLMPQSDLTPRHMTVIGGKVVNHCGSIMKTYYDDALRNELSNIIGEQITDCPSQDENVIITIMDQSGDTHGWHLDDYPIAFVVCLASSDSGGDVEMLMGTKNVIKISLGAGDAYLLRSDMIKHRVSPLQRGGRQRIIINYTFSLQGKNIIPNGSAELLCT